MPSDNPRIYIDKQLNRKIDQAHFEIMNHCGYKISKADFLSKIFIIGMADKEALYAAFPRRMSA